MKNIDRIYRKKVALSKRTWQQAVTDEECPLEVRLAAYDKWHLASNAATHVLIANLVKQNYTFYFGANSTDSYMPEMLPFLKEQGYKIRLMHISVQDSVRQESIEAMAGGFVHTAKEEVSDSGLLFHERLNDVYLKFADEINFYCRDVFNEEAKLGAVWVRSITPSISEGIITVMNAKAYQRIKDLYDVAAKLLCQNTDSWETLVEDRARIAFAN